MEKNMPEIFRLINENGFIFLFVCVGRRKKALTNSNTMYPESIHALKYVMYATGFLVFVSIQSSCRADLSLCKRFTKKKKKLMRYDIMRLYQYEYGYHDVDDDDMLS